MTSSPTSSSSTSSSTGEQPGKGETLESEFDADELEAAEILLKYEGFIARAEKQAAADAARHGRPIPDDVDFTQIPTLCLEAREKLSRVRPTDVGQASRVAGVSPADVSALLVYLETRARRERLESGAVVAPPSSRQLRERRVREAMMVVGE